MKVVAFNGSARKKGNTYHALQTVLEVLNNEGIETELIQLADKEISHCLGCYKCAGKKKCMTHNDELNDLVDKMVEADGILLGTPTYFANIASKMKALVDRAGIISKTNGDMYKNKVGAAVVAVRRQGACHAFSGLNYFFLINQMIIPGSTYWNLGIGKDPGDVNKDEEGMQTFKNLGKNMAWLLKKLK